MKDRSILTFTFDWQGIALSVTYEADWLGMAEQFPDHAHAHLEIRAVAPQGEVLPITETGYRSHFLHRQFLDEAGGPVAYVTAWLEHEAQSKEWRAKDPASRQLNLF